MFKTMEDLVRQAEERGIGFSDMMLEQETEITGKTRDEVMERMAAQWAVMKAACRRGIEGVASHSGMTGGDAKKMYAYLQTGRFVTCPTFLSALTYAVATNEVNTAMGVICATPTAGSCGVLPGVLMAMQEKLNKSDADIVRALLCAGAVGYIVANNACISGAAGGCQAEVGTASAMAAAAVTEMFGGTPDMAAHAVAIAFKNMMGLVCDPLAGLVEVPCIKRNAAGASNALTAAEMALAGVESRVPWDEVIGAMYQVGLAMSVNLRETAMGGLAATPTGRRWKELLWTAPRERTEEEEPPQGLSD